MQTPIIELSNVTAGYDGAPVLRNLSLSVPAGSAVGIIGPNGHGKTTLLRVMSGMVSATRGDVRLAGVSINRFGGHVAAQMGVTHIPQGDHIFPDMTVSENLLAGAYLHRGHQSEKLREIFGIFPRLEERQHQVASSLSGGERRMLALSRGIVHDGKLFLIDEPSLGLAPIVVDTIYSVIRKIRETGKTVVIVEENISRIVDLVDQIHLVDRGQIVASGEAERPNERHGNSPNLFRDVTNVAFP